MPNVFLPVMVLIKIYTSAFSAGVFLWTLSAGNAEKKSSTPLIKCIRRATALNSVVLLRHHLGTNK